MKKIVFSSLVMKPKLTKVIYKVEGDSTLQYDKEVYFPINGVLAKSLNAEDEVKVVLMKTLDLEGNTDKNEEIFKEELLTINKSIGAKISFETIESPFVETKDTHEKMMKNMIDKMEDDAEIYADITYGPKPQAFAIFTALKFAEKFYNATIKNIIYGKVDFDNKTNTPKNPVIYNLTSLYFINSIVNSLDDMPKEKAVKALNLLLNI